MSLTIDHPEVDALARELSQHTGESVTEAVLTALRAQLKQEKEKQTLSTSLKDELLRIGQECAALPVLDQRSPEEILGYDENGYAKTPLP